MEGKDGPRVAFIAGNLALFDVTPIQIYRRMASLTERLGFCLLVGVLRWKEFFDADLKQQARERFDSVTHRFVMIPRIPVVSSIVTMCFVLQGKCRVIHAIGYNAMVVAVVVKWLTHLPLVFEMHGLAIDEAVVKGNIAKDSFIYRIAKGFERKLISIANKVITVSEGFANEIRQISGNQSIIVCPCAVDSNWFSDTGAGGIRKNGRRGERFVVVFNGTLFSQWGDPREYISLFQVIRSIEKSALFVVLSPEDTQRVHSFLGNALEPETYRVFKLSPEEVMGCLRQADVGLLLRKDSIVNKVASPMKFAEYMAAGVPVIISQGVGDASGAVIRERLGIVLGSADSADRNALERLIKEIDQRNSGIRERCLQYARKVHSHSAQVETYISTYSTFGGGESRHQSRTGF